MAKTTKVTRKYTKKNGEVVIKTYEYKKDYSQKKRGGNKSFLLVGKGGVYKDRLKALMDATDDMFEKENIKASLEIFLEENPNTKLTIKSFKSRMAVSKIEKMFINAGYSIEEAAAEIGVTESVLLDPSNWDGSSFTDTSGNKRTFRFDYYGSVWH